MQVPELVPQIPALERGGVRLLDVCAPGDGFEHGQMRGARLVQAGEQSVDDLYAALFSVRQRL